MTEDKIYVVDYDMEQVEIIKLSRVEPYNSSTVAYRKLFNAYYRTCVFENLR